MEKTQLVVVVSLIITVFILIFATLVILAGNVQGMIAPFTYEAADAAYSGVISVQDGLMLSIIYSAMIPSILGAPLSWGAAALGLFNSNFGMSSFLGWYMLIQILASL